MVKKSIALLGLIGIAMSFKMTHLQDDNTDVVADTNVDTQNYAITGTDDTT